MTFINQDDIISFRHHVHKKLNEKEVELWEIGPWFDMKPYQILLGTID